MAMKLSTLAQESLLEIIDYYAVQVSEDFADEIEERILKQIIDLEGFEMGVPQSEVFPDARKLVISRLPYIAYIRQVQGSNWEVVDIIHTSRKIPKDQK
jgi:plasmid stabilization system protein ParE